MIQKKICLLGSFAVGKTSLISRYVNSVFSEKYLTTVGVKIDKKDISLDGYDLSLMIWDIAGEDDFTNIRTAYLRGMAGYIIVIDGTRVNSWEVAQSINAMVKQNVGELPVVFALNKVDLKAQWQINEQHIRALTQTGNPVLETSAKQGLGVEIVFTALAKQLVVQHG